MVSVAYSEAFVEVLAILDNSKAEDINAIPKQFIEFLKNNASQTYKVVFEKDKQIKDLNLKAETKGILSVIYYNYLCEPSKKQEYEKILKENQIKYEEELREKYNPDNIFKNEINSKSVAPDQALVEYKQSLWSRIISKIKSIFVK